MEAQRLFLLLFACCGVRLVFQPVVIQAGLSHCDTLRVRDEFPKTLARVLVKLVCLCRMDRAGGVHRRIPCRLLDHGPAFCEVITDRNPLFHPALLRATYELSHRLGIAGATRPEVGVRVADSGDGVVGHGKGTGLLSRHAYTL